MKMKNCQIHGYIPYTVNKIGTDSLGQLIYWVKKGQTTTTCDTTDPASKGDFNSNAMHIPHDWLQCNN